MKRRLQDWWFTTLLGTKTSMQPPLIGDTKTDVLIVGAGAAGLAAAHSLMDKGLDVTILERNICGGSSTGKSAGFLTPDSELELSQLLRRFGVEGARDLWECADRGGRIMRDAVNQHGIECDLEKQDSLFLGKRRGGLKQVQEEYEARRTLKYPVALYDAEELRRIIGSTAYAGAVRYSNTYGINALRYAQGLKEVLLEHGVHIYESSEVTALDGHKVTTHLGSVTAEAIIFCADKLNKNLTPYYWNYYYAQTFLAVSEPLSDHEVSVMFPEQPLQCWDSDLIYSYWRLTGSKRILLGGGSLWTTYANNDIWNSGIIDRVIRDFRRLWPVVKHVEFIQFWSGRIDMTRDLLPTVIRDDRTPWVHYVLGCVGLPWATFCGDFVARHVYDDKSCDDDRYYRYFGIDRRFLIPLWVERLFGKRLVFVMNNAWAKYYQKSTGK